MRSVRIVDISEFVLDGTHGSPVRTETGIPVLSAQNVKNGELSFETERFTSEKEHKAFFKRLPLKNGDVLLTIVGTIGRAAVLTEVRPLVFQRSVAVIRPNLEVVIPRFFFHATQTQEFQAQLLRSSNKSSQAGVYLGKLKEVRVPLPPLSEQRRIAEILDRAEELRSKRREAIAQLDTLTQAIFIEMFGDPATNPKGWIVDRLEKLIINSLQNGLYKHSSDYGSGTPILRIDAFYDGKVTKLSTLKRVRVSQDEQALYKLNEGDIVINRVNSMEYLGKSALIPPMTEPIVFESNMMRFSVNLEIIDSCYLVEFLQSKFIKGQILSSSKNAVNQSSINQQDVKGFLINIPPLTLQKEFSHRVEAVEKLKASHRASLSELDALFASLQHRAFRGEL